MKRSHLLALVCAGLLLLVLAGPAAAQSGDLVIPRLSVEVGTADTPEQVRTSLQLLVLLTVLTLAPGILIMTTAFTRIIIVLGLLRQALGTQQMPPNQVLIGLGLILTFFVMAPTFQVVNENALQPYLAHELSTDAAYAAAVQPMREFMLSQTREKDLGLFVHLGHIESPQTADDVPTYVIVPAFLLSELTTAFMIGFLVYLPFLIIDMVVASTLMSMGMLMLPPIFISLPFKIILFVLADGWYLMVGSLVRSFGMS